MCIIIEIDKWYWHQTSSKWSRRNNDEMYVPILTPIEEKIIIIIIFIFLISHIFPKMNADTFTSNWFANHLICSSFILLNFVVCEIVYNIDSIVSYLYRFLFYFIDIIYRMKIWMKCICINHETWSNNSSINLAHAHPNSILLNTN